MAVSEIQYASVSLAATGTVVAAQGAGVKIRVVSVALVNTTAQTAQFKSAAGGTALTGAMALGANGVLVLPFSPTGWFETLANQLLELALAPGTQISGVIGWVAIS